MTPSHVLKFSVLALLSSVGTAQAITCIHPDAAARIQGAPSNAAAVVVFGKDKATDSMGKALYSFKHAKVSGDMWVMGADDVEPLKQFIAQRKADGERANYRVMFVGANGMPMLSSPAVGLYQPGVDTDTTGKDCDSVKPAALVAVEPLPANETQCRAAADGMRGNRRHEWWMVFSSKGAACYVPPLLRQGDRIHFAMLLNTGERLPESATADITNCTTPGPAPVVFSSGGLNDVKSGLQASEGEPATDVKRVNAPTLVTLSTPAECASDAPVVTTKIVAAAGQTAVATPHTLRLYKRYHATIHVGVLYSRLRDPDFGLRAANGQNLITDKEADGRGPETMALVILQAPLRYLPTGGNLSYPGRDPLHDNEFSDRLGLVFGFGLKNPAKRFGVGASFELARGFNVVALHEWVKRNRLNGVSLGGSYAGAAADIPTKREWSKAWTFGLSFDTAYVTDIFKK